MYGVVQCVILVTLAEYALSAFLNDQPTAPSILLKIVMAPAQPNAAVAASLLLKNHIRREWQVPRICLFLIHHHHHQT